MDFELVTQEQGMGCAVACVASLLGITYEEALGLFEENYATSRGYYCGEIVGALERGGLCYSYVTSSSGNLHLIDRIGTIIFVGFCEDFPFGHFLLRTKNGWMDPWINMPNIIPVEAGFRRKIPCEVEWIIYENDES